MKVKILRGTVAGGESRKPGDEIDIPDSEARFLIAIKKAAPVEPMKVEKDLKTTNVSMKSGKGK